MKNRSIGIVKKERVNLPLPKNGFQLENHKFLPKVEVTFERYGTVSDKGDNIILICHALTGDAHAAGIHSRKDKKPGWWDSMVGPGKGIDTNKFHVICSNVLGGCKGTTGPSSANPKTGKPYGTQFPEITIGDMVEVQKLLMEELGIKKLYGVIGGSAGGAQVLEWCFRYPDMVENAVCIASSESLSAQALSFDIVARNIIMADPLWNKGNYYNKKRPDKGLSLARMIGHITYLSKESMDKKFGRERRDDIEKSLFTTDFQIESYLNYQGKSFIERFDANSFLYITKALDAFSLTEREKRPQEVYRKLKSRLLIISVSSDWLYPAEQSKELAENLLRAGKEVTYCNLSVPYGHDSFLIKNNDLTKMISSFFWKQSTPNKKIFCPVKDMPRDFNIITKMIEPDISSGIKLLDLGCGDGTLLCQMLEKKIIAGHGIDIDYGNIVKCTKNRVPSFQVDLDEGLGMIPDNFYDYAILSRTLLEVHKPALVLKEMLRVAKTGILSFPNFANWKHRLRLGIRGRLPMTRQIPYSWYDTPNLHFLSIRDFRQFCRKNDITILESFCIPNGILSRLLVRLKICNLGADQVIMKIVRKGSGSKQKKGTVCTMVEG
ncbi:MAG: homoserine O-acetyltransferase [Spirochaetes bacterium]|nr:homoserine O-acetyltransferase [Spirochaetota bacterium]